MAAGRTQGAGQQPNLGRLWLSDGFRARLQPAWKDHTWTYDFARIRTLDSGGVRLLTVMDDYTRERLSIRAVRSIRSPDANRDAGPADADRGSTERIRSDNGPEFTAMAVREWLGKLGARTLYIEPVAPWENGYIARASTAS